MSFLVYIGTVQGGGKDAGGGLNSVRSGREYGGANEGRMWQIKDGTVHCEEKGRDVRENRCDGKQKCVETGGWGVKRGGMNDVVGGVGGGGGMAREGKVMSVKAVERGRKKNFRNRVGGGKRVG